MSTRAQYRILIVEDGAEDRMVYRLMLTRRSTLRLAITLAANGEEGLEALRGGTFDCMLLDYNLPDMTGLEMLEQARQGGAAPGLAVVMVTGSSDARIVAEAERQGVRAVLMKDHLDDTSLRDAIDSAIAAASRAVDQGRGESERMLSIAEARHGLAATFGVPPSNVEIIIHS